MWHPPGGIKNMQVAVKNSNLLLKSWQVGLKNVWAVLNTLGDINLSILDTVAQCYSVSIHINGPVR
jgi:hypothetical protein